MLVEPGCASLYLMFLGHVRHSQGSREEVTKLDIFKHDITFNIEFKMFNVQLQFEQILTSYVNIYIS